MDTNRESATQTESGVTSSATQTDAKLITIKLERKTPSVNAPIKADANVVDIKRGNSTQTESSATSTATQTETMGSGTSSAMNVRPANKQNKGNAYTCPSCDYESDSLSDVMYHRSIHWFSLHICRHRDCVYSTKIPEELAEHNKLHVMRVDKKYWIKDFFCECQQPCCERKSK